MSAEMSLNARLDKIRSSPNQSTQQHTAVVLSSIDDTFSSTSTDPTPTAYFAALLSLLGQYLSSSADSPSSTHELATAVVYLLDLVTPHVPQPLVRAKFSNILSGLAPALTQPESDAPLVRSAIGVLESLLVVQDSQAWALPASDVSPRRAVAGLLNLAVDHRPKVRKRALDSLATALRNPPPSPSLDHPASDQCAEAALRILQEEAQRVGKSQKRSRDGSQKGGESHEPRLMHALQLVRMLANASNGWPAKKLDGLVETLLEISRGRSEYLVTAAFEVFEIIFARLAEDEVSRAKLPRLLEIITELQPNKDDSQLLPPWIAVLSRGYDVAAQVEPEETFEKLPSLFETISGFMSAGSHNIRVSASECLISLLSTCVPDSVILEPSIMDEKVLERLGKTIDELLSVRYQAAWMEVFNLVAAAFESLRWRADPVLRGALKTIGDLRANDAFAGKKEADAVISAAFKAVGPDFVLDVLPLNLAKPKAKEQGRAWLLPLMRTSIRNTRLAHFRSELVPLSESMFQRVLNHGGKEKTMEIKIFETVVQQIWDTQPGYCDLPIDLAEAFDQSFAELVANLAYQQPQLRTSLCRGLQNLVTSNQEIVAIEGEDDLLAQGRVSKQQAAANLQHLSAFAGNLLAVLFNVYGETLPQYRGLILQCINSYLSIIPKPELNDTFGKVASMLETAITEEAAKAVAEKEAKSKGPKPAQTSSKAPKMPPTSHTLMDLIITMSIHLPPATFTSLFTMASKVITSSASDPQLQKKAYKLIPRLASSPAGLAALEASTSDLQTLLLSASSTVSAPAKRDRLDAMACVVPCLPLSDLSFIPSILSEVVMAVKEVNEKARTAAFDLLVLMGERLSEDGGNVVQSRVPHMGPDAPTVSASLAEYFTMVSAGLAGNDQHMVSACITALARLLYEFHSRMGEQVIRELVDTVDLFLTSNNREIVQSCLGFVKVCVLSLPAEMVRPRLESLVPKLLVWSKEHKAHFKSRVKHILERMVRKFGVADVERWTPEADKNLIRNIRKTKERAKRKRDEAKSDGMDVDDGERSRFDSGYDEALAEGSESDDSGSDIDDDEVLGRAVEKGKKAAPKSVQKETFIVEDGDEPLDLLGRNALAHVSSTRPGRKIEPKQRKAKRDLDGKLVFNEDDDAVMAFDGDGKTKAGGEPGDGSLEGGINAYVDAIKSQDAPRRGAKGKLKFKNVREGKGGAEEGEKEVDVDDVKAAIKAKTANRAPAARGGRGSFGPAPGRGKISDGRRGLGIEKQRNAGQAGGGIRKKVQIGRTSNKFRPKGRGGSRR